MLQDRHTVEGIYRDHGHVVLARARQILGDEHEARDVLHEVFTTLLERPEQFAGRSAITTWLYAVTTHLCLNTIRNNKTRARLVRSEALGRSEGRPASGDDRICARALLDGLPSELAEAAVYYHVDEMTQEEIAHIMGCSRRRVGDLLAAVTARVTRQEAA